MIVSAGIEQRFLRFLQVFVIGKGRPLTAIISAVAFPITRAALPRVEFEQIGIFFLRHRAAARRVGFGQADEAKLLGGKQNHLFRPAAEM